MMAILNIFKIKMLGLIMAAGLIITMAVPSYGDDLVVPDPFQKFSNPDHAILLVQTTFDVSKGRIRLTVYKDETSFLEQSAAKFDAPLDDTGLALFALEGLEAGDYAFITYLDENNDGKLNRNILGKPKEPYIFSNNFKPKLRKPEFDDTKIFVSAGKVNVLTLDK